jgi:hypothetical protein
MPSSAPGPQTASAASSVKPPAKTLSSENSRCDGASSSSQLQSIAPRSVCWRRGTSRGPALRGVLGEDRGLSALELAAGLQPEILDQIVARPSGPATRNGPRIENSITPPT